MVIASCSASLRSNSNLFAPRRMKAPQAAHYVGESKSKFRIGVKSGKWPQGTPDGGNVYWFREDLDRALDRLKPQYNDGWGAFVQRGTA